MCGRFVFSGKNWPDFIDDHDKPEIQPNYNTSPQDESPVVHMESDQFKIASMQWGLRPSWSKKSSMEPINVRIETVQSKPMFRDAYQQRRCIVPADGWYEWMTTPRGKVPFYHRPADNSVLLLAGIYEQWSNEEDQMQTFGLLTQEATPNVAHVHNRMPVLLNSFEAKQWIQEGKKSINTTELEIYPVAREVNKSSAQGAHLIRRLRTLFD